MTVLRLAHIHKDFSGHKAVNDVSLSVAEGAIFGLLGPNGAGKTTLIRIITNILVADRGQIWFNEEPLKLEHRHHIGYMPEERGLYKKMKVGEQLLYLAMLKGLSARSAHEKINHWLEKFDISDWRNKKIEALSKGMQQKIQFISTVVHQPELLILDEPFSGLDPVNTNLIKEEIYNLRNNGTTIIFSTHRMEQVEEICEDIILINQGQTILEGRVKRIKQRLKENKFSIKYEGQLLEGLDEKATIVAQRDHEIVVKLNENVTSKALLKYLVDKDVEVIAFNEILPTLNEIFIKQVSEQNHA